MERQGGRGRRLGARTRAVAGGVEPGPRRMLSILTAVIDRRYSLHFGLFRVSVRGTRGGHGFLLLCTCAQAQSTGQNSRDHDHF